ncbi:CBS domain-containing protein [Desulfolutivibrio sulfoxidireducens]|uniref:CBS domain-containing protein n=1 Tax=Desulfolutivibrio sulfoxidireducens TaxID=2773299 RepID=UPI00159E76D4|nr:CBS domain-containing protein [Desulfolutivibrio sulfoxidireducens]
MVVLKRRIREICSHEIVGIGPGDPVSMAIEIMRGRNISSILVLEDKRPLGIFTERSVVRFAATRGLDFSGRRIAELMSSPVLSVTGDSFIHEALSLMAHSKIRHLVVVDEAGRAEGMLTQSNLIEHLGHDSFMELKRIDQIMSRIVFTVPPDFPFSRALGEMADKSLSCLVVTQDEIPLGILTERDVVRLSGDGPAATELTVAQVMQQPVLTVEAGVSVAQAAALMRGKGVRRLVVTNGHRRIQGLATQSNVVKALESNYIQTLKEVIRDKEVELMAAYRNLREKTVYLDNIMRSAMDMGIVAANIDFCINYYNPAAERLLGVPTREAVGKHIWEVHQNAGVPLERLSKGFQAIHKSMAHTFCLERPDLEGVRHIEGQVSGIRDEHDRLSGYVLMLRDVTERLKAEEIIRHMAYHDPLTDLPNRTLLHDRLDVEIKRAKRNNSPLAVVVLDLDRFKAVNDTMGHMAGDLLLRLLAVRLRQGLRESDTVARMGGDEFTILLPDLRGREDAMVLAHKIRALVEEPFLVEGRRVELSASLGLAVCPEDGDDAQTLIKMADDGMYRHKRDDCERHRGNA